MDNKVEACSERICDHVHRSLARMGSSLMENRRNTISEIDPRCEKEPLSPDRSPRTTSPPTSILRMRFKHSSSAFEAH